MEGFIQPLNGSKCLSTLLRSLSFQSKAPSQRNFQKSTNSPNDFKGKKYYIRAPAIQKKKKRKYIAMFVVKIYTYIFLSKDIVNIYVVRAEI